MVGAIVLSTEQGLGYLAKSFYDNGIIDKVLIKVHSSRENHPNWFFNGRILHPDNYEWFFEGLSSILYFEEPFEWKLLPEARERGIKNVFMPMYECTRNPMPYEPDVILCPSLLDLEYFKGNNSFFVPVPVKTHFRRRTKAMVFVHNAGNGGLGGRNGTKELLEAMRYVKSPIKLIIRTQAHDYTTNDPRIEIRKGTFEYETLYEEGDVFIFPEKFNGLSLPIQEAFASGMVIMCGARFPMTNWLPNEPMIPVKEYKKERIAVEFDSAVFDPQTIAATIDNWYGKDISSFSMLGKQWAKQNSWKLLKPIYEEYTKR